MKPPTEHIPAWGQAIFGIALLGLGATAMILLGLKAY